MRLTDLAEVEHDLYLDESLGEVLSSWWVEGPEKYLRRKYPISFHDIAMKKKKKNQYGT